MSLSRMIYKKNDGQNIKRLHDSDDEDSDEKSTLPKLPKREKPTDVLTDSEQLNITKKTQKPAAWDRSIGGSRSVSSKAKLSMLVKKKTSATGVVSDKVAASKTAAKTNTESEVTTPSSDAINSSEKIVSLAAPDKSSDKGSSSAPSGLLLLGAYSDSGSDSNGSDN